MVGRSKRRIVKIGTSKGVTLPVEWLDKLDTDEVHVVFDKLLIIFDDEHKAEKFAEAYISKVTGVDISRLTKK